MMSFLIRRLNLVQEKISPLEVVHLFDGQGGTSSVEFCSKEWREHVGS